MRLFKPLILALPLLAVVGCAFHPAPPLPTYPDISQADAIRVLSDRAHAIRTISAEGLLTLTHPDGQSIRLDAAIAISPPDKVRLRAWKFGQAVFDLTLNDTGVYLVSPPDSSQVDQIKSASISAARLARTWSLLFGSFFDDPHLAITTHLSTLDLHLQHDDQNILCTIERATLTPRRYTLIDPDGQQRFSLTLNKYALINNLPWPLRLTAISDAGTLVINLHTVEINADLNPAAFIPPRRAEKLP
jgi:outer membrane lipoprotein-sorting protein